MNILSVSLLNFRNYASLEFQFPSNVLVLVGCNGSGKTNFLEALSFLGTTRSFRARSHWDVVKWGEDVSVVSCEVENSKNTRLGVVLDKKRRSRTFRCNKETISVLDFMGKLPIVLFSPDDVLVVSGSPKLRRRYIDVVLSQAHSQYFRALIEYQRAVKHRNTLLASVRDQLSSVDELQFWDEQLVELGVSILSRRFGLLSEYNAVLSEQYRVLSAEQAYCFLEYVPSFSFDVQNEATEDRLRAAFSSALQEGRDKELRYGRTLFGPHLDDFTFYMNDRKLSSYGSRGEVRTMVLALKMAERQYLQRVLSADPIMLFDDVFSELDPKRQGRLLHSLQTTQIIFTATDIHGIQALPSSASVINLDTKGFG